jgi:hypothetical protein
LHYANKNDIIRVNKNDTKCNLKQKSFIQDLHTVVNGRLFIEANYVGHRPGLKAIKKSIYTHVQPAATLFLSDKERTFLVTVSTPATLPPSLALTVADHSIISLSQLPKTATMFPRGLKAATERTNSACSAMDHL